MQGRCVLGEADAPADADPLRVQAKWRRSEAYWAGEGQNGVHVKATCAR